MRRDQVEHAIRAACQIIGRPEVIVMGSQAILGDYPSLTREDIAACCSTRRRKRPAGCIQFAFCDP